MSEWSQGWTSGWMLSFAEDEMAGMFPRAKIDNIKSTKELWVSFRRPLGSVWLDFSYAVDPC
jgi:hypothetical protein